MARPEPLIYERYNNGDRDYEIIEGQGCFVVLYDNKPFNVRSTWWFGNMKLFKYHRSMFANKAHAMRLANKLNEQTKSKSFTVARIDFATGKIIKEQADGEQSNKS